MTLKDLESRLQNLGFRVVADSLVGVYNGYPVTLDIVENNKGDGIVAAVTTDGNISGKTAKAVKDRLPKGTSIIRNEPRRLIVACNATELEDPAALSMNMLEVMTSELRNAKNPRMAPSVCPICKKDNCDSFAYLDGVFTSTHRHCLVSGAQKNIENANKNESGGNYVLGTIGAILGALVGTLPSLLTIVFMEMEYGMLYFLIPMAAYFGYKLFRGKKGTKARIIVILATVAVYVMLMPTVYHIVSVQLGYNYTYWQDFVEYYSYIPLSILLQENWFGLLFLIFGIGSSFKMLGTTNKSIVQDSNIVMESITNLDGSYSPVDGFDIHKAQYD